MFVIDNHQIDVNIFGGIHPATSTVSRTNTSSTMQVNVTHSPSLSMMDASYPSPMDTATSLASQIASGSTSLPFDVSLL